MEVHPTAQNRPKPEAAGVHAGRLQAMITIAGRPRLTARLTEPRYRRMTTGTPQVTHAPSAPRGFTLKVHPEGRRCPIKDATGQNDPQRASPATQFWLGQGGAAGPAALYFSYGLTVRPYPETYAQERVCFGASRERLTLAPPAPHLCSSSGDDGIRTKELDQGGTTALRSRIWSRSARKA